MSHLAEILLVDLEPIEIPASPSNCGRNSVGGAYWNWSRLQHSQATRDLTRAWQISNGSQFQLSSWLLNSSLDTLTHCKNMKQTRNRKSTLSLAASIFNLSGFLPQSYFKVYHVHTFISLSILGRDSRAFLFLLQENKTKVDFWFLILFQKWPTG